MKTRLLRRASAGALALTLIGGTAAIADTFQTDGDSLVTNPQGDVGGFGDPLNFGSVCPGDTVVSGGSTTTVSVAIRRAGQPQNSFAGGQTLQLQGFVSLSDPVAEISVADLPAIGLPADWLSQPVGTTSTVASPEITLEVADDAPVGPQSRDLGWFVVGSRGDGVGSLTRSGQLRVNFSVVSEGCDESAPNITPNVTGTLGNNGWYTSDVTVAWDVTDPESAVTSPPCASTTITEDTSGQVVSCTATSAGGTDTKSVTIKRDATAPEVSLVGGPAQGASYYFGSVPASPTCSAGDATSGLDGTCAVSGYSAAVGTHTVSASAKDLAGNSATASSTYTVLAWDLGGFYAPIDLKGTLNTVKAGSTVPLKFEVFAGTDELRDVSAVASFTAQKRTCDAGAVVDDVEFTSTGGTSLRFDTTGDQFIQNWQTPKAGAGNCYLVTMTTQDGSFLSANFKLK